MYISADKGNKKVNKNLANFICWYNIDEKEVKKFLLDINYTDESTSEITDATAHSLKGIFPDIIKVRMYSQSKDSARGVTKLALSAAMHERDLVGDFFI